MGAILRQIHGYQYFGPGASHVHQTFCSLNSGPRGGVFVMLMSIHVISVSAKEDLVRVEIYVQEWGQLTIRFRQQCEK